MAVVGSKYAKLFEKYISEGKSAEEAHTLAIKEADIGAQKAVKEKIKPLTKSEVKVKQFLVQSKMDARLKVAEEKKADKERLDKLSKMTIEELKELRIKRGK